MLTALTPFRAPAIPGLLQAAFESAISSVYHDKVDASAAAAVFGSLQKLKKGSTTLAKILRHQRALYSLALLSLQLPFLLLLFLLLLAVRLVRVQETLFLLCFYSYFFFPGSSNLDAPPFAPNGLRFFCGHLRWSLSHCCLSTFYTSWQFVRRSFLRMTEPSSF